METKHTAGPWHYRPAEAGAAILRIECADGKHPAFEGRSEQEKAANAKVMATSPELLETLTNLVGLARLGAAHLGKYHAALADAEAIIAKATA